MSEEDTNFLISIQDLDQPEFDNACLERENKRLNKEIERLHSIIKEVRELLNQEWYSVLRKGTITKVKEILDKEK